MNILNYIISALEKIVFISFLLLVIVFIFALIFVTIHGIKNITKENK